MGKDSPSENVEIGVICSACGYEAKQRVGWVRKHTQLECPNCGFIIDIESSNFRSPSSGF
ncbi:putative Zn finger protein [Aquamicrobium ahrensii]|uniref:Zn finger protein n=1 Tax=Aquamicrobium ahrensii TaxID=469551 RepID=A0ABV2KFN4_9HYPH